MNIVHKLYYKQSSHIIKTHHFLIILLYFIVFCVLSVIYIYYFSMEILNNNVSLLIWLGVQWLYFGILKLASVGIFNTTEISEYYRSAVLPHHLQSQLYPS